MNLNIGDVDLNDMVLDSIIRSDLEDAFYINEVDDKTGIFEVNYMDFIEHYGDDIFESFKKNIIRELRFSKLLDGDSESEYRIKLLNLIEDQGILSSNYGEKFRGDVVSEMKMDLRNLKLSTTDSISLEFKLGNMVSRSQISSIISEINNRIESIIVNFYLELSMVNESKLLLFYDREPFTVDNDSTKISAKISMLSSFMKTINRKCVGNLIIVNPFTYMKNSESLDLLNVEILKSNYIPKDKIIVTVKEMGVEFNRFVYKFNYYSVVSPTTMESSHIFNLDYSMVRTSKRSENFCILMRIV